MKNEIVDAVEKMLRDSGPWKSVSYAKPCPLLSVWAMRRNERRGS